ncbi:hypothetical protein M569_02988 [Genlisea aurea]|uniref:Uncharacterized protein n=1 Tax=Genlisea aurea TaxID=192259 RepID=S8CWI2_9LAMI|nr:hypothetical protein M569_02988 [Genlisea aurea]
MALASQGTGVVSLLPQRTAAKTLPVPAINHKPAPGAVRHGHAKLKLRQYFEHSADLMVGSEGGPPRWFLPLDVAQSSEQAPVMLYLPGPIGDGLGLMLHHHRLGKMARSTNCSGLNNRSSLVRMAAKFGAKIIPFGAVGEDDVFPNYDEQMKVPSLKNLIQQMKLLEGRGAEEQREKADELYLEVKDRRMDSILRYQLSNCSLKSS